MSSYNPQQEQQQQQQPFVYFAHPPSMQQPTPQIINGATTGLPQQQQPFVYYPQIVMGQNGQQYILPPQPRFTPQVYTTPVVMDQQASSSIPLEHNLQQVENNNTTTRSCSWSKCKSSKFCKYVKENRWFTAQIVLTIIMAIFCIAALIMYPMVGGVLAFKIGLAIVCCVAAYKKKYLALSFFSGSMLVDLILSSFIIGLVGNSHSDYYYVNPALTLPFQISFHILELSFLIVCLVLTAKIHREVHTTSVPAQENVVPVLSTETPVATNASSQENYSRLQDEQESQQEAVQRYYPSLNNNNNL